MFDEVLFHLVALLVAVWAIFRGYRRGLTGMVTSVLGMAFGIVCANIFADGATEVCLGLFTSGSTAPGAIYLASNIGCGAIFFMVYFIFRSITGVIRAAMSLASGGLLNSLLGAAFCLFNYMLMLSIVYNVYVGMHPDSKLMRYGKADDGNICAAVMWFAPGCLGSESFSQFALEEQLREAKKISFNNLNVPDVIEYEMGYETYLCKF